MSTRTGGLAGILYNIHGDESKEDDDTTGVVEYGGPICSSISNVLFIFVLLVQMQEGLIFLEVWTKTFDYRFDRFHRFLPNSFKVYI